MKLEYVSAPEWQDEQRLEGEKETLGLYLTGHPVDRFRQELSELASVRLSEVNDSHENKDLTLAGLVISVQKRITRSGEPIMIFTMDDGSGRIEAILFRKAFREYADLVASDRILVLRGTVSRDRMNEGFNLRVNDVYDIDSARDTFARRILITVDARQAGNGFVSSLANALKPHCQGQCPIALDYSNTQANARINLGDDWKVSVNESLLSELKQLAGQDAIRVIY
jgi:DNA polymerase-3 subunit alpha